MPEKKAAPKKPERPVHYWWHGRDLCPFLAEIERLGIENVRIEFHPADGMLHVVPVDEGADVDEARGGGRKTFNFVHVCPPDCA